MRVNISRAYSYPRNKRAAKALAVLKGKLERHEEEFTVSNEVNNAIWKRGAQKPPKKIDVEVVEEDGENVVRLEE